MAGKPARSGSVFTIRTQLAAHLREDLKTLGLQRRVKRASIGGLLNEAAEEHEAASAKNVRPSMTSFNSEPLTVNDGQSERCANPFCQSDMTARTGKKSCCDRCRMDRYVLRRARAMIDEVGVIEFFNMITVANRR